MKLALIGKNIQHSRSPYIYQYKLGNQISYQLLDIPNEDQLPTLAELQSFTGVNITSPYKESYLSRVHCHDDIKAIGSINCIKINEGQFFGTNTDYLALEEILLRDYQDHFLIIWGRGAMARALILLCQKYQLPYQQLHRGNGLVADMEIPTSHHQQSVIVNCCSREFIYTGPGSRTWEFWDLNYALSAHSLPLPQVFKSYTDGQELLWKQAQKAIDFWLGKNFSSKY